MIFVIYDRETGEIKRQVRAASAKDAAANAGEDAWMRVYDAGISDETHIVAAGEAVAREDDRAALNAAAASRVRRELKQKKMMARNPVLSKSGAEIASQAATPDGAAQVLKELHAAIADLSEG